MFTVYNPRVIIEDTIKNDGGSFTLDGDGVFFESGYMVALYGYEHQVTLPDCMFPQLERSLHSVVGQYMQHINRIFRIYEDDDDDLKDMRVYIGTWINEDVIYLDVSRNIEDKDEAINYAKWNKQKAVWDNVNKCEIGVE